MKCLQGRVKIPIGGIVRDWLGHRPNKLPWGENENAPECLALKASIARKVEEAYLRGYRAYWAGGP